MVGSARWWAVGIVFFVALELVLRIKLGSIFAMCWLWVLAHQWLSAELYEPLPRRDMTGQFLMGAYTAAVVSGAVFLAFSVLNIIFRTAEESIRFFQLP